MRTETEIINQLNIINALSQIIKIDNDPSFAGEYLFLDKLVNELGINKGFVVDIAASNGFSQSCTLGFFKREGWKGIAIEMDPIKFSQLAFLYADFTNAKLGRNRVTPNNIVSILDSFEAPLEFDILNLDIDSYDLYVIDALLKSKYKPKIISMEINEKIPNGIFFTVNFDEEYFCPEDHFFGCSIDAASIVVKPYGYTLSSLEYNNAIFIRNDLARNPFLNTYYRDLSSDEAYESGYKNKSNRLELFPWNNNVNNWLTLLPRDAMAEIEKYFQQHNGKFTLRLTY